MNELEVYNIQYLVLWFKRENKYHYILFLAELYENVVVKMQKIHLDYNPEKHFSYWDDLTLKIIIIKISFFF